MRLLPAEIDAAPERHFITYCVRMSARSWFDDHFDATSLWEGVEVTMTLFDDM
ncbi:hypothetical protein [Vitiosangium sp. GDMCC 1.1324]|uniref:hypothetical protein n=1 Tax=Vitiosangium sp. (strain GDMCC 1.1324) TaxID=2138576 RepID=UPI00130E9D44|nr:hypothetical protein [Vitiosangium sp. GDMCC 1.1324]